MRVINELRDPWAIAFAEAAAFASYLFGAPAWQIAGAAAAVLGARVVAGLAFPPGVPTVPPVSLLTDAELAAARYLAMGRTEAEIARRTESTEKAVHRRVGAVFTKLGFTHDWELREWALALGLIPDPPARHWYERTLIRGTLSGAGLISLCWTLYQIGRQCGPGWFS